MTIISQKHFNQKNKTANDFIDILTHPDIETVINKHTTDCRNRHFTTPVTLSMFMSQTLNQDSSCANAVTQYATQNPKKNVSLNTSAFCQARIKLPVELVKELIIQTGGKACATSPKKWGHKGRNVKLIDGSTTTMPDTKASQIIYPQLRSQKEGLGFPICRFLTVNCLSTGAVLEVEIESMKGKGTGEASMLNNVIDSFNPGEIILGDAIYSTYFILSILIERGIDIVFEQNGTRQASCDFKKGEKLGKKDHLMTYPKPKKKPDWMTKKQFDLTPNFIVIRELKVNNKIIITTMLNPKKESRKSLGDLYKKRWNIEVDFRNIKTTLKMCVLSCKTPEMCKKEMLVTMLAYNVVRIFMAQSANEFQLQPRSISFKHSVQVLLNYLFKGREPDEAMIALMAKRKVGNRPGRVEPRAIKRRPKPYPLLMKLRTECRADILKNGHPSKMK